MRKFGPCIVGVLTVICTFLFVMTSVMTVGAVPSFARRHKMSCSTCHTVFPALNAYGRLFRAKGYRLPGAGETIPGEAPLGLGPGVDTPGARSPLDIPFIDIPATSVAGFQVISVGTQGPK